MMIHGPHGFRLPLPVSTPHPAKNMMTECTTEDELFYVKNIFKKRFVTTFKPGKSFPPLTTVPKVQYEVCQKVCCDSPASCPEATPVASFNEPLCALQKNK